MDGQFLILLLVVIAGFAALFFAFRGRGQRGREGESQALLMLQSQLNEIGRAIDAKIIESAKLMQSQTSEISQRTERIIRDITERLTRVDEGQKQVRNFADQLKNLQDILKNPKQRGVLGEYYLETVLKNVLPPGSYQMQYAFRDGAIVDAVIFVKDKIIPVDSKFSLENYNRILGARDPAERERMERAFRQDLKNRIDETAKYVKPGEGTMDFAFMFIPAEAVFYDLLVNKVGVVETEDLVEYAFRQRHVIIVSPTSFLAYLQTVLQGLRALQIEESAKAIRKNVEDLRRHLDSYETHFKRLGGHLGTTVNMYNTAYKELGKVDKDVLRITGKSADIEPLAIAKPAQEEEV
ncbi:MAG: DNA recombination protein RmuC [Candidatus Sungbacteria bacterium]|uniref:DNA recombination protein RmuC n=1 Tax=Candidatus Sungiibacteriota bacterium TaxID=2750080 RepID=A0A932YXZ0_9BACT|nr:DNA recombination protein RmuC [Candidatus Sungbacteria bacterium]